ncbi:hypothetical protein [Natronoglycomyces albus]|uniref:Uncharacterized protein n=1 Tax=Natronoglycomyces albus TaxID=2811108 RepID=A0A895XME4_9ACTN|nr:hypothetical protein [Natronoglycomyces albus]QSB06524.1 hypothetical protein JQS30_06365 [Natronoglycomyces albus]
MGDNGIERVSVTARRGIDPLWVLVGVLGGALAVAIVVVLLMMALTMS